MTENSTTFSSYSKIFWLNNGNNDIEVDRCITKLETFGFINIASMTDPEVLFHFLQDRHTSSNVILITSANQAKAIFDRLNNDQIA